MVIKIDSQQNQAVGVTVTSRRSSLRWCLILSLIVHGLVLFIFLLLSKPEMRSSSLHEGRSCPLASGRDRAFQPNGRAGDIPNYTGA